MNGNVVLAVLVFYPMIGGLVAWALRGKLQMSSQNTAAGTGRVGAGADANAFSHSRACSVQNGETLPHGASLVADFVAVTEFLLMLLLFATQASEAGDGAAMSLTISGICGFGLNFTLDGFRLLYGLIAGLMWMMTALLCPQYFGSHGHSEGHSSSHAEAHPDSARFYVFFLLTLGATLGVFFSADLYTTFIFFEMMSFTSYVWVAHEENNAALRAADTYLTVAVLGGLVMLMGIFGVWHELGTLTISELSAAASAYENKTVLYALGGCMFFGFAAKAGAFPLHIWLPKAHPL
ncbi:MAG: hypothetical protein LUF30_01240, partial [Lachnospiraceae bacterium]|nr:hypothetical protein [Lachnospiraceae bacterium]